MFDELWSEIQDAPGEIFDHPNINEVEIFDSQTIINSIAKVKSPCEIALELDAKLLEIHNAWLNKWHFKLQSQKQMFPQFVLKLRRKQGSLWTNPIMIFVIGNVLTANLNSLTDMNDSDLYAFKENYANHIIDGMDIDTLAQFAYDTIMNNLENYDEDELRTEVTDLYGKDVCDDLSDLDDVNVTYGDTMLPAS